jgi:hypothetical protein
LSSQSRLGEQAGIEAWIAEVVRELQSRKDRHDTLAVDVHRADAHSDEHASSACADPALAA